MTILDPVFPLAKWTDIKKANIEQWETQKALCTKKCSICNFPLPDVNIHTLGSTERCSVCVDMDTVLYNRSYWGALNREESARRTRMGIE